MAIVRGAFSQLFTPGLRQALYPGKTWFLDYDEAYMLEIERQDEMALIHPDTSAIPIWRRRPTRVEHPLEAWRAWGMELDYERDFKSRDHDIRITARLHSVAADCEWEGPVLRSHKRPVDPKYWDSRRAEKLTNADKYYAEMRDTLEIAGVWAVRTKEEAANVAYLYHATVYGRIKMWGRIARFELGYRAEVCMIDELWVRTKCLYKLFNTRNDQRDKGMIEARIKKVVQSLENRYQCKVNLDDTRSC